VDFVPVIAQHPEYHMPAFAVLSLDYVMHMSATHDICFDAFCAAAAAGEIGFVLAVERMITEHGMKSRNMARYIEALRSICRHAARRREQRVVGGVTTEEEMELFYHKERYNSAAMLYFLGEALEATADWSGAAAAYQEAIEAMGPAEGVISYEMEFYGAVMCAWGLALKRANRFDEALAVNTRGLNLPIKKDAKANLRHNMQTCANARRKGFSEAEEVSSSGVVKSIRESTAKMSDTVAATKCANCGKAGDAGFSTGGIASGEGPGGKDLSGSPWTEESNVQLKKSLKKCSGCASVYYCCAECQKANWKQHKPWCKKQQEIRRKLRESQPGN